MLVVAERFFCPSLELISEYLRLPPCVAGATLLSFGNGAPDVFTQLAAISQGDGDGEGSSPGAVAMALSEPLGSGLFVGNVVMALVIYCSGAREVHVQRRYFLKDVLFYLAGVAGVLGFLLHGVVMLWEVALLAAAYLSFIGLTIALARGDEPLHADPRLHEVPHRLRPLDSFFKESFRITDLSIAGSDLGDGDASLDADVDPEAAAPLLPHRSPSHGGGGAAAGPRRSALASIDETGPSGPWGDVCGDGSAGDGGGGGGGAVAAAAYQGFHQPYEPPPPLPTAAEEAAEAAALGGRDTGGGGCCTGPAGASPPRPSPLPTFAPSHAGGGADATIAAFEAAVAAAAAAKGDGDAGGGGGGCFGRGGILGGWAGGGCVGGGGGGSGGGGEASGGCCGEGRSWARSGSGLRRELSGRPPGPMQRLWRRLERPVLALLSLFMPRIDNDAHARYRKTYAVLLPPLLPSAVGAARAALGDGPPLGRLWREAWWQRASGAGLVLSLLALRYWPRKGHLHGAAAGIATVLVFGEAMVLLDGSAGELVSAAVALGQIHGISPALLGATLLAWGNSVSDLVSNTTLARDGLPSMAITACFASPLFVLLAGLVTTLTYATRHGDTQLPRDASLRVLYGAATCILAGWALAVPLLFRFRLSRRVAALAVGAYLAFQAVYITAVVRES